MKTKALLLSVLILAPSAGAAAAQSASTQEFRVQTGKALAAPAQDFRVSYGSTTQATTPTIFDKSNLPQALSDEELDEVVGENNPGYLVNPLLGVAISAGMVVATPQGREAISNAGKALFDGGQMVLNSVKEKLSPNTDAKGPHCTWKCDGHVEWTPNPRNPSGWDQDLRVRTDGGSHGGITPPIAYPNGKGSKARSAQPGEYPASGYPKKP